ncbi:MAG: N-acetylneuraminate synthase family protein [Rhodothermaceae bacterium]
MRKIIQVGEKYIGDSQSVFIIAEIGINHNGSLDNAKKMIDGAVFAGCDAVKFQKRTPELCVPRDQWEVERGTPWGRMTYLEYRHKVEFGLAEYEEIDRYCRSKGIIWFASCWDEDSVDFIEQFDVPLYKAASASLTDHSLLRKKAATGKPLMLSTGMSTEEEIISAVDVLPGKELLVAQSTSAYPCKVEELNLNYISALRNKFCDYPIGYSGHETGLAPTLAAVAIGASFVERHFTLDRAMWGSDQAASVEIVGMHRLVSNIRDIEKSLGNGIKKVYESEYKSIEKLRRVKVNEFQ